MKKTIIFSLVIYIVGAFPFAQAEETTKGISKADKLKAVFIYNFTEYIQWPDAKTSAPFVIAIIGKSPLVIPLKEIAQKKKVSGNRKIEIKLLKNIESIKTCQILFISASEKKKLAEIVKKVKGKHILTISDSKGFAARGVAINFVRIGEKVKFEMNRNVITHSGFKVSSQLLKLAIPIREEDEKT